MESRLKDFQETVWQYYHLRGRDDLPWRQPEPDGTFDPYKIMVSEVMLQQTQVSRVATKYQEFLRVFPAVDALAQASFSDVLRVWSGLGYNRRAKFLFEAARIIKTKYDSQVPGSTEELVELSGIGPNTAAAILAYAYNKPKVFIETNIRSVFIHHFFTDQDNVSDKELLPLIEKALDKEHPREWYWALMDYGSYLKTVAANPSRRSKHHVKQSTFEGSRRQLRAKVLRLLLETEKTYSQIFEDTEDDRLAAVLLDLEQEGLIVLQNNRYRVA